MEATLSLSNEPKTVRLILNEVATDELAVRQSEAHAGCNCDRWGHPCPGCVERNVRPKVETPISSPVKQ